MKKLLYPAIITILVACSSDPSESRAKNDLAAEISKVSEKKIELTDFKKTDAQSGEFFGVKLYELEFEGKVRYSDAGFTTTSFYNNNGGSFLQLLHERNPYNFYKQIKKGQVEEIKGSIRYEKKESGWVPGSYKVFLAHPSSK